MCSVENYKTLNKSMRIKNEYQNFFKRECFTHHITLPPSTLNEKSVLSAMRKIEFKLNMGRRGGGNNETIIFFGIKPLKPHTGYGYIKHTNKLLHTMYKRMYYKIIIYFLI